MGFRRRENASLAGKNLPAEFQFRPTRMYYSEPPRNIIYEDALGSNGQAPLDPTSERMLDPVHWQSGRSPIDNMKRTTQGVVSRMTHHLRHERSTRPALIRNLNRETTQTHIEEAPGARQPRLRGYRTPQEVAKGAKLKRSVDPGPTLEKVRQITASKRGFTSAAKRSYEGLLAHGRQEVVENLATQLEYADKKKNEPRIRIGGSELTRSALASMPPGYRKEIFKRRAKRDAQEIRPRVRFDPRETKGLANHGQFTKVYRPGLKPIGDGLYAYPEQAARGVYSGAIVPTDFGDPSRGALGSLGQTATASKAGGALGIAAVLLGSLAGIALLVSAAK